MLSQSQIATSAAESRYRISYPNSSGRLSLIIALDESSFDKLRTIAQQQWMGARFRGVKAIDKDRVVLTSVANDESELSKELDQVDVVVMVATHGSDAAAADPVGKAAFSRHIMTAGFVDNAGGNHVGLQRTLKGMRPFVISLFVGFDDDALVDILAAIRA